MQTTIYLDALNPVRITISLVALNPMRITICALYRQVCSIMTVFSRQQLSLLNLSVVFVIGS
jgi:hypothetical protein